MKVLLALQVIGQDLRPIQIGVSTSPDLIRQFVRDQRGQLRRRVGCLSPELQDHESRLAHTREAVLDTVLDLMGAEDSDRGHQVEDREACNV